MRQVADIIGEHRAALAALILVRAEHEVEDVQLAAIIKQISHVRRAVWAFKNILLVDLDHWQATTLSVQRITRAGRFLLLSQQRIAGSLPRIARYNLRKVHSLSS